VIVKEKRVSAYRIPTCRDVEDWRKEPAGKRQGSWAVHCLDHDQRTFFPTYTKAKDHATLPQACSVCKAFDQRCIYCPADIDLWIADRNTGYTPSVGHIAGNAVCTYHKYGALPENIDYEQKPNDSADKTIVEIAVGQEESRTRVITVAFQPIQGTYCLELHLASGYITLKRAAAFSRALSFALSVAASLTAAAEREAGTPEAWGILSLRNLGAGSRPQTK